MAKFSVNKENYIDPNILVDENVYDFQISNVRLIKDDDENNPPKGLLISFKILEGPFANHSITQNFTLDPSPGKSGQSKNWSLIQLSEALGYTNLEDMDTDDMLLRTVSGKVKHNSYKDRSGEPVTQAQVSNFKAID